MLENKINEKQISENLNSSKEEKLPIKNRTRLIESDNILSKTSTETVVNNIKKSSLNSEAELQNNNKNDFNEYENQIISDEKLNNDITFLAFKKVNIPQNEIPISPPAINSLEPENNFEELPKRRLVFIPPSEVFASVTPMLSYYFFSPNKGDNVLVNNFTTSSERLCFAAQLGFIYPIAKKLDLRTGLSFMAGKSKISYGLTDNNQKIIKVIDELNIEIEPTKSVITENRNWQYVELQSDLLYKTKQFHYLSLGMRVGVQTTAFNKPVFNGRIGYRVNKPVNNRIALWLEPSISFSISSQSSIENHFLYRTTGFGLNMGVSVLRH